MFDMHRDVGVLRRSFRVSRRRWRKVRRWSIRCFLSSGRGLNRAVSPTRSEVNRVFNPLIRNDQAWDTGAIRTIVVLAFKRCLVRRMSASLTPKREFVGFIEQPLCRPGALSTFLPRSRRSGEQAAYRQPPIASTAATCQSDSAATTAEPWPRLLQGSGKACSSHWLSSRCVTPRGCAHRRIRPASHPLFIRFSSRSKSRSTFQIHSNIIFMEIFRNVFDSILSAYCGLDISFRIKASPGPLFPVMRIRQ